ncbi:chondroadherin-like protein [Marmota marmota marmota]|uniref:chondroadherin-like protein n=1 Tax=Marmota marmota marmota TaxID=9994 RepID=UPI002092E23C|nr:chondroadherin-like protein [Marmota marmota marmota]
MEGPQSSTHVPLLLPLLLLLPLGPAWQIAAQRCPQTCICDNSRLHVACRHQNLTEVPNTIPELTQRLDLQGNMLKVIPPAAFQALPYLTHLDLRHCQVELVAEGAFRGLGRLLLLNLGSNRLSSLPQEALDGLGSLRRLELERNMLEELRPGTFGALGALATLNLAHNALVYLPAMAFERGKRSSAGTAPGAPPLAPQEEDGAATPCPRACVCAAESRHSGCEGRGLQAVPRGFPNGTQLLDLRRNHFPSVPRAAFPGLGHLVSLHLQHCGITELEAGALAGLGRLLYLYLSDNRLSGLSAAALEGAPHLGYLYLERNRFLQVPGAALRALPSLFSLHLQDNAVDHLAPGDLAGVRALRWLYLSGNRITQVSPGALGTARELEKLYLDRNQLREVPTRALEGLPALLELQLSGNPLRALQDGNFRPVGRSLQHLFLNSSDLEQISPGAFSGLELGLQSLHLQKNQLRALPALPNLRQLELIDLSGNPFHCDCQLLPLHRWLAGLNLRVGATCATPPSARGQRVKAAAAVFRTCPGWAARKARRTPTFRLGGRRTPIKRRQQEADKLLVAWDIPWLTVA